MIDETEGYIAKCSKCGYKNFFPTPSKTVFKNENPSIKCSKCGHQIKPQTEKQKFKKYYKELGSRFK